MNSRFTWINGEMIASDQATVPFLTAGLHYGVAIFEGIRAYKTPNGLGVFRLREHMKRFEDSSRIVGFLEMPHSIDEMMEHVCATVRANGFGDCQHTVKVALPPDGERSGRLDVGWLGHEGDGEVRVVRSVHRGRREEDGWGR